MFVSDKYAITRSKSVIFDLWPDHYFYRQRTPKIASNYVEKPVRSGNAYPDKTMPIVNLGG